MSFLEQLSLAAPRQTEPVLARQAELSQEHFVRLRRIIYDEAGIFFPDNKKYLLESRLGRRLTVNGLKDYGAYLSFLQGTGRSEVGHLIEAITINETFFFRNTAQLEVLEQQMLPSLIKRKQREGGTINVWSAACSSGEEPYSLAMLLKERVQPMYPSTRFRIVGTDINTKVLETARRGVYREYAVRQMPAHYRDKYFSQDETQHYHLRSDIRAMVEFRHLNLVDRNGMRLMRHFDIIFCANVLIYFDQESKRQVVNALYDSLDRGGTLFVGFSESLYGLTQAFRPAHFEKTIAYIKE